jgi:hypothetical protein
MTHPAGDDDEPGRTCRLAAARGGGGQIKQAVAKKFVKERERERRGAMISYTGKTNRATNRVSLGSLDAAVPEQLGLRVGRR